MIKTRRTTENNPSTALGTGSGHGGGGLDGIEARFGEELRRRFLVEWNHRVVRGVDWYLLNSGFSMTSAERNLKAGSRWQG